VAKFRMLFAADVHGSEKVWKIFLRGAKTYEPNVMVMAGDITGKAIIPLVKKGDKYVYQLFRSKCEVKESGLEKAMNEIRMYGFYPTVLTPEEVEEIKGDKKKMEELFKRVICHELDRWMEMVEEYVPKDITVIVNPGNDDEFYTDDVIKKHSDRVVYPLGKVVDLYGYEMISCEWVNPTPWNSPRECSERELMKKLEREFSKVDDPSRTLCNFHAPPYGTNLDLAPKLDKNLKPKVDILGQAVMENVGSKAVRKVIERYKPFMGLHGHIHESSGEDVVGGVTCINPGSDYSSGVLLAYVIDFEDDKVKYWHVRSG